MTPDEGQQMYPNLKLQLWKSGIRQNRLARQLGVDETVLSRIVNGFREPNSELQGQIATLLKCDVQWLFSRQNESDANRMGAVVMGGMENSVTEAEAGHHETVLGERAVAVEGN